MHIRFTLSVKFANSFMKISTFQKNLFCFVFYIGCSGYVQPPEICSHILTHDVFSASIPPGRSPAIGPQVCEQTVRWLVPSREKAAGLGSAKYETTTHGAQTSSHDDLHGEMQQIRWFINVSVSLFLKSSQKSCKCLLFSIWQSNLKNYANLGKTQTLLLLLFLCCYIFPPIKQCCSPANVAYTVHCRRYKRDMQHSWFIYLSLTD